MTHKEWKYFLVRRFLMILLLVGASEHVLGMLYDKVIFPWLYHTMHIQFFTAGLENGHTISMLVRGGLYLAVTGLCSQFPEVGVWLRAISEQWAGSVMVGRISSQTIHLSPRQTQLYIWGMVALTVLILFTLLIPYVAAAFAFSRMVEQQLSRMEERERRQKEEYDRRKNLLLSDVAHDLKTPMTTVAGYAKALLLEGEMCRQADCMGEEEGRQTGAMVSQEKQQEYLETIYNKSMQMSGLLNLLFEYVKLDSEGFRLKKTREDLWELLRDCAAGLYMDFEEKGMEMEPQIPEEECWLEVDRVQFQRVINNLLNNALKHNPPKTRIWILAEQEDEEVIIRICDDGEVIPWETARYIFDPFVLGDDSRNSKKGGSGLGLSIAYKAVSMHGGSLALEQREGEAYTKAFVIRLPLQL